MTWTGCSSTSRASTIGDGDGVVAASDERDSRSLEERFRLRLVIASACLPTVTGIAVSEIAHRVLEIDAGFGGGIEAIAVVGVADRSRPAGAAAEVVRLYVVGEAEKDQRGLVVVRETTGKGVVFVMSEFRMVY